MKSIFSPCFPTVLSKLKEQCHEMVIFVNQYFLCMRCWLSMSFKSFSLPYTLINFLFASLKLLTYFENAYLNPPQNSLLCDWSMFSSADLSLAAEKMRLESTHLNSHFTLPLKGNKMACQCTQYAFVFKQMRNFPPSLLLRIFCLFE